MLPFYRPPHLKFNFIYSTLSPNGIAKIVEKAAYLTVLLKTIVYLFSLNDYGWITIGSSRNSYFSELVIAYIDLNRMRGKRNLNVPKDQRSCRKNYSGSAKEMEVHAAGQFFNCEIKI